ncbi:MAG: response regulator transcription factor [Bacteroides sp.]|nr:response regulator transcription factor [Eubacterium sp.]MCM1419666.1 response regulator transcription factor [Roseburia sp.]MCM1463635.1 response regulator transcription factor [Bacteroides sp.]
MEKILVIDDDVSIGNMVEEVLTREGYAVRRAYSGTEALLLLERERPDLILLDLMLPGLSGEALLPAIRGVPVIVVSAKTDADEKAALLLSGAADYVTKPFHTAELVARIKLRLREAPPTAPILSHGELALDPETRAVTVAGNAVRLTKTEYAILKLLLYNPSRVIPKSAILDRISLETPDCVESSLKIHISNLRKKLRESGGRDYIETVWGIGFKLRDDPVSEPSEKS